MLDPSASTSALTKALSTFDIALEDTDQAHAAAHLRRLLEQKIAVLLDQNPALLMSILYRIDVRESAVKAAIANQPPTQLPQHLADLVLARWQEKLQYREAYRDWDAET